MTGPVYTRIVQALPASVPFVGPETQERARNRPFVARLGANENVFGPSPKAIEAMQQAANDVWMYGDPENHDLRHALADFHGVAAQNVIVGEGIDGLLGYLARLFIGPGDRVVTSAGAYPTFNFHVTGFGGSIHSVPYLNDHEDPEALLKKAQELDAKLIYLANPDNPMGSCHSSAVLTDFIARVPKDCLLILDEAYVELAPDGTAPDLDVSNENVIRMRTFSKAYGMAGARIGYGIGAEPLITSFNKIRNHFGVSRISQAGALAALQDQEYLGQVKDKVANARLRLAEIAQQNGLVALPSSTNFVTIDCGHDGNFARAVLNGLIQRDVFVRMPFVAPQDRCIRISAGTEADMTSVADALPAALAEAIKTR